ncbi:hypothetical protein Tco_1256633 [Tanacetum coccineum]
MCFDPPMWQKSVQIIPGLLMSHNKLEEILAMVEEKRCNLLKFLIISWTQREAQQVNELSNLTRQRQLLASVDYRHAIIEELERLPRNLVAYKTRKDLKRIQKAVLIKVIELKKEFPLQGGKGWVGGVGVLLELGGRLGEVAGLGVVFGMGVGSWFVNLEQLRLLANSDLLKDQLLVYFNLKMQRKVQLATKINNLTTGAVADIIDEGVRL